jgi:hypothetical protein
MYTHTHTHTHTHARTHARTHTHTHIHTHTQIHTHTHTHTHTRVCTWSCILVLIVHRGVVTVKKDGNSAMKELQNKQKQNPEAKKCVSGVCVCVCARARVCCLLHWSTSLRLRTPCVWQNNPQLHVSWRPWSRRMPKNSRRDWVWHQTAECQ